VAGLSITVRAGSPILARPWLLIAVLAGWLAVLPASPPLVDGWLALLSYPKALATAGPCRLESATLTSPILWQTVGQNP